MSKSKTILAIVGMPGSGKSLTAAYFNKQGYPVIRFGKVTDEGLKSKGQAITPENEQAFREQLRRELGMAAYAIKVEPLIATALKQSDLAILDGLYSWEEYQYLLTRFPQLKLLAVYAQPEIRYQRLGTRKVRPLTPEQARSRDVAELKNLNKGGPIAMSDFLVTNNEKETALFQQLDQILESVRD